MFEIVNPWQVIQVSQVVPVSVLCNVDVDVAAVLIPDPAQQFPDAGREDTEPTGCSSGKLG